MPRHGELVAAVCAGVERGIDELEATAGEQEQELVLYEFVEVLIRIGFWRANPYHGINKLAAKLDAHERDGCALTLDADELALRDPTGVLRRAVYSLRVR